MGNAYFRNLGGANGPVSADSVELDSLDGTIQFVNAAAATVSLTRAIHCGKTLLTDQLAGCTVTLPNATGSGDVYHVMSSVIPTSNSDVIKVARSADTMVGWINALDDTSDNMLGWVVSGSNDTITMNRTNTGGNAIGEEFWFVSYVANIWMVRGQIYSTGSSATPMSAGV